MSQNIELRRQLKREKQAKLKMKLEMAALKKEVQRARAILRSSESMNPLAAELFRNELRNGVLHPQSRTYTEEIKDFAVRQSFYSNAGYRHLRSASPGDPGLSLPSTRSIRRYLEPIECNPGYLVNVMNKIHENIIKNLHGKDCTLVMDETNLKKALGWDPQLKTYLGLVSEPDDNEDGQSLEELLASHCLVFLVVGLDGKWRHPVGFWFTNHDTAANAHNLVMEGLRLLHENEIRVRALVFDGLSANCSMANLLGARLDPDDLKNWFEHPSTKERVYIILDACHMLKLVRNLMGDKKELFIPGFEKPAKWDHFEALHEQQEEIGLKSGNRLSKNHVQYGKHKMKVVYAAQVFSRSVAASLDDAREDGTNPRLQDSEPTCYLARKVDCLFDFCNSRSPKAIGQRAPLTPQNYEDKKEEMMKILDFLQLIQIRQAYTVREKKYVQQGNRKKVVYESNKVMRKVLVKNSNRKTCVVGFVTTVHSIFNLAQELFKEGMSAVYTYLLLQDYLEQFFGQMRQHGGWNDNPTPVQIKYIMRKMISVKCGRLTSSTQMNCSSLHVEIEVEEEEGVPDNTVTMVMEWAESLEDHSGKLVDDPTLLNFKKRILAYIAGYVVAKLGPSITCTTCYNSLLDSEDDKLDPAIARLIQLKNRGGLKVPSRSTYQLIEKAEEVFMANVVGKVLRSNDNLITCLTAKVLRLIDVGRLFPTLRNHLLEQNPALQEVHNTGLVKAVLLRYLKVRCLSYCNVVNKKMQPVPSSRNQRLKLLHYQCL